MKHFGRRGSVSVAACLATVLALSGCGASPPPAEKAPEPSRAPGAVPSALPILPPRSGAATTCAPLLGHASYATQSCEACHPCGAKATSGHPAAWSDQTSAGFHAYSANGGLSNCQGCHGTALDGVGGTAKTSCAQCHGAAWKTNCVMCHGGTDNQTGAPAKTTWGNTADAVRVGTHTAHVAATHGLAAAVACATCHVQPVDALAPGHVDGGTAEVIFSGRAIQGVVATPAWTRATSTCSNTYCHGATLQGGTATAPVWTRTDGTQRACNSCHGAPPPAPHSTSTACATCHGAGYSATTVNVATHMNGVLDVSGMTCTSCHGTATRAATALNPQLPASPPVGTKGETLTTTRAVGAHQAHLVNSRLRSAAIACTECHVVPSSTSHSTGVVDMTWGTLAKSAAVAPTWTGTTCTNYCHGATLVGGTAKAPTWVGDATQAACASCHGAPPANAYHTRTDLACGACHTGYTATAVNAANHINATLDYTVGCTTCHGNSAQTATQAAPLFAAPPTDAKGNTAITSRGVGTHQIHLVNGTLRNALACSECHTVPSSQLHANGTVEVVFGTLAKTGAVNPAWNGTGCAASYCHGNFTNGNTAYVPTWTVVAANKCGTCHGTTANPAPGGTHPSVAATSCGTCHTGYTGTTVNLTNHMNGTVEVTSSHPAGWNAGNQHGYQANLTGLAGCKGCHGTDLAGGTSGVSCTACHTTNGFATWDTNCTFCHGNRTTGRQSPPVDIQGRSVATNVSVGRHDKHVASTVMTPIACGECHVARTTSVITDTAHIDGDGIAEVTFGTLARTGGTVPVYTRTSATASGCSATYCHGNFTGGSGTAAVSWVSATAMTCTSCHGNPPATGRHGLDKHSAIIANCGNCHSGYAAGSVNPSLHVNGTKDVGGTGTQINSWNASTRSCGPKCHGGETW